MLLPIADDVGSRRIPYATYLLIGLNVGAFALLGVRPDYSRIVHQYGYVPSTHAPLTLLTATFLHASLGHLLGNMLYLWIAGSSMEEALGPLGMVLVYLLGGVFGNFAHGRMASEAMMDVPCVGASGAIATLLGAYIVVFPFNRIVLWCWVIVRAFTFRIRSFWALLLWFGSQLSNQQSSQAVTGVAYGAHIGGFLAGSFMLLVLCLVGVVRGRWQRE